MASHAQAPPQAARSEAAPTQPRTAYPGGVWAPGPARFGAVIIDDVPITMDDGVVLLASVSYPTDMASGRRASGRFPVVIEHTPYVTLAQPVVPNTFLTEHGYIYAVVRARGTGRSGGEVQLFSHRDGRDGSALVDWAAHRLDGADGRVALLGCSYPAGIALATAAQLGRNSPVKAVVAACNALGSLEREVWLLAGLPTTGLLYTSRAPALMGNSAASVRFFNAIASEIDRGGDAAYSGETWRERIAMRTADDIARTGVPVLLWSGWGDIAVGGVIRTYTAFQNAAAGRPLDAPMTAAQATDPRFQLLMGDWPHAGGLDAGIYLQWLETWVKGVDTGLQKTSAPMHVFETGSNRWVNLRGYPVAADTTSFYLRATIMDPSAPPAASSEQLRWTDPSQPDGKLTFTTAPFTAGATIAGPISATLYASSSNTNLIFLAKLFDVDPEGRARQITRGAVLGSLRALDQRKSWKDGHGTVVWPWPSLRRDSYMKPDQVYRIDMALAPHQHGLAPGHSLRLEITSQAPGEICPADRPANGASCVLTAPQRATLPGGVYTISYGRRYPSALHLPLLPWNAFAAARAGAPPTAWNESERRLESRQTTLPLDWESFAQTPEAR